MKEAKGIKLDTDLSASDLIELVKQYKNVYIETKGEVFPSGTKIIITATASFFFFFFFVYLCKNSKILCFCLYQFVDPKKQLQLAVKAVFDSWDSPRAIKYRSINQITGLKGTAVNIQCMVFGNMGNTSGTGVLFTRNPSTGEKKLYGEFLINAQVTYIY